MQKNKKIGILTFSYSCNSGSVMQAFALQKIISSLGGYDAHIIHYSKTQYGKPIIGENVFAKPIKGWNPKKIVRWIVQIIAFPLRMRKYEVFFKKYYNGFAKRSYLRTELPLLADSYDTFVVGSDQVWNYGSPQVDDTYFLDFVSDSTKKVAYAASFGQKGVPEEKRETARRLISEFSSISVREPNGVDIVSELTAKEATWVLDPSLLLPKAEYQKLSTPPKKKGYVLLYLRQDSKKLETFAKKLARAKGLTMVKISNSWLCVNGRKTPVTVSPHQWLGYVENADYVVTNSFHGICFSIIFEREFFIDFLKTATNVTNSRLEGMLQQFHLKQRCIDDVECMDALPEIDYAYVNERKELRKKESLAYLKNALMGSDA